MNTMEIKTDLEAAMRQLCEIKNKLRKVAAMLTPEQERQPDLFSDMGLTKEPMAPAVEALTIEPKPQLFEGLRKALDEAVEEAKIVGPGKAPAPRKTWKRLGVQMKDEAIVAAEKVGRKNGWCQRSDIERSIVRKTGRSREDVRKALNYVLGRGKFTCIKSRSYRYYRTNLRDFLIVETTKELGA